MAKSLSGIILNNGSPGRAFGGGIYNMSSSFGGSTETTKVTLNIVSENGQYAIDDSFLDVTPTGGHTIQVGSVTFYNMYLYKYGFSQSAGQRTLNVQFVDASICLDKVYVGLNARHAPATAGGVESFAFDIQCVQCNSLIPNFLQTSGSANRYPTVSAVGTNIGHPMAGGFIMVGKEAWSDNQCSIPKVDYSFSELLSAMGGFNPSISSNLSGPAFNKNSNYRQSYIGTLREVLNNWASDFSFEFYFDPFTSVPTIVGVDLTSPSTTLDALKATINSGFDKSSGSMIRDYEEVRSLENTYRKSVITKSMKPGKTFTRNQVGFEQRTIKPITIQNLVGQEAHQGRTDSQLRTSIALAKYQSEARIIWLSATIASQGVTSAGWGSLGFIPDPVYGHITDRDAKLALTRTMGLASVGSNQSWKHPVFQDPDNYDVFVGVYNETHQRNVEEYDRELSDFIGKYGYFSAGGGSVNNPPEAYRKCPDAQDLFGTTNKFFDLSSQITTLPNGNWHKNKAYPFSDLLRASNGQFALAGTNHDPIYIVPLDDNAWGTHEHHVDELFENQWVDSDVSGSVSYGTSHIHQTDLQHYVPVYSRLMANVLQVPGMHVFKEILPDFENDYLAQDKRVKGYFPGIAVIPKMSALTISDSSGSHQVLGVTQGGSRTNAKVFDNRKRRILEVAQSSTGKKDCTLFCDQNIVEQVCECPDIQDPIHHFSSHSADSIVVTSYKGSTHIIFPVENDYIGYVKSEITYRGTYPKEVNILGSPPAPSVGFASNYMEADILDIDVTSELDPNVDSNQIVQKFLIFGQSTTLNLAQVHALMNAFNTNVTMANTGGNAPTQKITLTLDATDYGTMSSFINPRYGLVNFSLNLDGEGLTTNFEFSNRHPKPPKKEVIMQKIGARSLQGQFAQPTSMINHHSGLNTQFIPWH